MSQWCDFQYRDFWNQPRLVYIPVKEAQALLLDGTFDDALDEYPSQYQVLLIQPLLTGAELSGSWESFVHRATLRLGALAIPPCRKQFDLDVLAPLWPLALNRP